jgi:hypothetical protein
MKCSKCKIIIDNRDANITNGVVSCYDCYYEPIRLNISLLDWDLAEAAEKAEAIAAGKTLLRDFVSFVGWAGFTFGFTLFAIAVT